MLVDTYSSNKHFGKRLTVPTGSRDYKLPLGVDPDFGSMTLIRAGFEILSDTPHAELDTADVIAQIDARGYAFHSYRRSQSAEAAPETPELS
jgi:hypothetical protein